METVEIGPKLKRLQNFLTDPDSEESKNYIHEIISKKTERPEDLFLNTFITKDLWYELGYLHDETNFEAHAGIKPRGRIEWTIDLPEQKIGFECKKPYTVEKGKAVKHELDGEDNSELTEQIEPYLWTHSTIIYTNGFHWFFYSQQSYLAWMINKNRKGNKLKPYFKHLTSEEIFNKDSPHFILNILHRNNILDTLSSLESKSARHIITKEFFLDLKIWISYVDEALKLKPTKEKPRTTTLFNKLIFVRTMEGVGIIPNGFLSSIWNEKKAVTKSTVKFIDQIDDQLNEIYDTELFTSEFVEVEDGRPKLQNGNRQYNPLRQKNFAYSNISPEFFSALVKPSDTINVKNEGKTRLSLHGKEYYIRSLYYWKFESIPADILGRAYETYLAEERKKLGIYYTPQQITEYLTSRTINKVFDEKIVKLKSEIVNDEWDYQKIKLLANKIVEIKICDPSCGSGSFLIQAMRIIWKKYKEIEYFIRNTLKEFDDKKAKSDKNADKKYGLIRSLGTTFRINDERERIGTIILRHIYGNDKDEKAVDTGKLNIWLECLRLDPNSFKMDICEGKRHVLPNLELNITKGDSLIGLDIENIDKELSNWRDSIKSLFGFRQKYVELFESTSVAQDAVRLREAGEALLNFQFMETIEEKYSEELMYILSPTHWALQHVAVFYNENGELLPEEKRGFDVVIGNPPWEALEPNIDEFFGLIYNENHEKKFSKLNKKQKNEFVEESLKKSYHKATWDYYNHVIDQQQEYYNKTKSFLHQTAKSITKKNRIEVNLYKLFLEKYYYLLKKDGVAGIVLPAGFYTDVGCKGLRELILNNSEIFSLYGFDNKKGIFDIHRQLKFMIMVFKKGKKTNHFKSKFNMLSADKLSTFDNDAMDYDVDLIKRSSPNTLSFGEWKDQTEVGIMHKMYQFPHLGIGNKLVDFQREFNMSDDSGLFNENGNGSILFEGKMINQFTHQFKKPLHWIETDIGIQTLKSRKINKTPGMRKKINQKTIKMSDVDIDYQFYRLGWRDATNATNQRTLISTILPPGVFLGNTIYYLKPTYFDGKKISQALNVKQTLFLCGLFNSFVVDFIIRHKITTHATMSQVRELPIPVYKEGDPYFSEIVERVGLLICTTKEFDSLKKELHIQEGIVDEDKRDEIISQINAYAAKIYGLTKKELEHILSTFPQKGFDKIKLKIIEEFNKTS